MQYIAMNQFRVAAEQAEAFESRWHQRRSLIQQFSGFEDFRLLRGHAQDGVVTYTSLSTWISKVAFEAWIRSDQFVQAHRGEPIPEGMLFGPPQLSCFEVVMTVNTESELVG